MPFQPPKLVPSRGKLYGRDKELNLLRNAFRQAKEEKGTDAAHRIFIGGSSGTGKSALIEAAFEGVDALQGSGKFEDTKGNAAPFSAVVQCLSEVCEDMARPEQKRVYGTILSQIFQNDELSLLVNLVPKLATVVDRDDMQMPCGRGGRSREDSEKLKRLLCLFLQGIALAKRPLLMILDDLHWMDEASLELMKSLLSKSQINHFVFVGSFRDDEVDSDHILANWMDEMTKAGQPLATLTLEPLQQEDIENLLSDLLKKDDVQELAELVHRRTYGNAFHVLQLLDYLSANELITFSTMTYSWTWDVAKIRSKTILSDNVLDIVSARIDRLSEEGRTCLKICSCFGFRFDREVLMQVSNPFPEETFDNPEACLKEVVEQALIEQIRGERYKFVHDRVRQAALKLIPDMKSLAGAHLTIGKSLWQAHGLSNSFEGIDDGSLFLCCDQLNLGKSLIDDDKFKIDLLRLNLLAGKRAASFSAFLPAVGYLQSGVGLIAKRETFWSENYALCLELFTLLAEMSFIAAQTDICNGAVNEVITHAKNIQERFPAYVVKVEGLVGSGDTAEILSTGLFLLKNLGEKFPTNPNKILRKRRFARLKKRLGRLTDDEILKLPAGTNTRVAQAIHVLTEICVPLIRSNDRDHRHISLLLSYRMVELTLDYGVAPYSAIGLSLLGIMFLTKEEDFETAWRLSRLSKSLLERPEVHGTSGKVMINVMVVAPWRKPLSQVVDIAYDVHKLGMKTGNLWTAFQSIVIYGHLYFYSGLSIKPLVTDIEKFFTLMTDYGYSLTVLWLLPCYQFCLNLLGRSNSVLDISSQAVTKAFREKIGWANRSGEHSEWSFCMQAALYCEDIERAASYAKKLKVLDDPFNKGLFTYQPRIFYFAIIAIWQARETGKRQYTKQAKIFSETINTWVVKKKNINMGHKNLIVKAELLTLEKKVPYEDLKTAYDQAISASIRAGFLQDGALAAHLASLILVKDEEAYFDRAQELYLKWGAVAVVEKLRKKRNQDTGVLYKDTGDTGTGYRSRTRYSKDLVASHKSLNIEKS